MYILWIDGYDLPGGRGSKDIRSSGELTCSHVSTSCISLTVVSSSSSWISGADWRSFVIESSLDDLCSLTLIWYKRLNSDRPRRWRQ